MSPKSQKTGNWKLKNKEREKTFLKSGRKRQEKEREREKR